MDRVVAEGAVGRASHVPASLPPGSDVANLSLLGYNPLEHYTGRAPLEAVAQGIELDRRDWAVRCNLVTIQDQVMRDFTADHISTEEAATLIEALNEQFGSPQIRFWPGVSYRNLMTYRPSGDEVPFSTDTRTTPPHDLTDSPVLDGYPRGPGSDLLNELMTASAQLLADHSVNARRRESGKLPATNVWLWGLGSKPELVRFQQRFGIGGAMITAVDLLRGLATLVGWHRIEVPGATGYTDTDYAAKGRYAIDALDEYDLVFVHVEATDEASHEGDAAAKIEALQQIDRNIVAPVHEALRSRGDYRILVTPDHPTLLRTKTHAHGHVPLAVAGTGVEADGAEQYDESAAAASALAFDNGWELMPWFLGR
jgi:2,3-bisphosphoglycerate-independent phosphoglycerate mutase